ncbi:3-isopropylmalate dehydratase large subunit [Desulfitobacterium dichloroeliminans LMG P-21439]|uniref:3-isopropylmalate dehydratase large subunit n=1 Tax=Desulfitobacterium dichloroeliminans (strain LMG P-21439 / DCA1) TaxID=871963 RepID=L0F7T2_DESDL|nr:aconitase family protein [Desulfitobacterium dichloroeliminans]AGA69257.1 3-isopropylmalate dehydratase large subunit [Desulfitobacterium dichloroeliminans LMG P-21439]
MNFFNQSLAKAASLPHIETGQEIDLKVDLILGHDGTWPKVLNAWKNTNYKLAAGNKVFLTLDHGFPALSIKDRIFHQELSQLAKEKNLKLYKHGEGVLHQVLAEEEALTPGMLIVGADGHVATAGAFGAIAFSLSPEQLIKPLETGYYTVTVPETVTITLENQPIPNVMARDIALTILGNFHKEIKGKAVALTGSYLEQASIDSKMTLCNLLPEGGALTAFVIPTTESTEEEASYTIDVSTLEPMVAVPPTPTNVQAVSELLGKKITVAIIGGCSAGRMEDMLLCASVLKDKKVHSDVTLIITPASSKVANKMDGMGITSVLRNSGAVVMPPGCGPCPGKHFGLLSPQDIAITTTIRNSPGRIGSEEAEIFLASPLTVALSALKGEISASE